MVELPFTTEQFLDVFRSYNEAIWPAQIVAYGLGVLALLSATWDRPFSDRATSTILAVFWLWMGAFYHLAFFSEINNAATLFGALFIVQGLLFLLAGPVRNTLSFRFRRDAYGIAGAVLILYALVIYPLLGLAWGHAYPAAPVFGVAPCPTTIFTFGLLLWTTAHVPGWLLIIPGLWTVVGFSAALKLGMYEDLGLLVAGVVGIAMLLYRNHTSAAAFSRETRAGA